MLILFDQGTPVGIRNSLPGRVVRRAHQQGWSALLNGEAACGRGLPRVAEAVAPAESRQRENGVERTLLPLPLNQNRAKAPSSSAEDAIVVEDTPASSIGDAIRIICSDADSGLHRQLPQFC
jgi:hypothetical protein